MIKKRINEMLLTAPSLFWLLIFFLVPTVSVLLVAFHPADAFGNILSGWTLENIDKFHSSAYWTIIWRTLWMSAVATVFCVIIAIPVAYYMILCSDSLKRALLVLIIVPFWTHFLIRVFAWKAVLNPEGFLRKFLIYINLISEQTLLLYNPYVVLLVIIYTYIPFAILPIFAAADKFDFALMEAAYDLGASRSKAFFKIFIPNISAGIIAGGLMVFIPALGSYVIPEMVGGIGSEMVGNMIAEKVFVGRNVPEASAWASILILVIICLLAFRFTYSLLTGKPKAEISNL
jgi:spermidine/putrescine transport system permease protein